MKRIFTKHARRENLMKKEVLLVLSCGGLFFLAIPAYGNMVWPALYLEMRLFTWWSISAGLLVEYLFLRRLFQYGIKQAMLADLAMNGVSTILGLFLIPLSGIGWEILGNPFFGPGTFNPVAWGATFGLAVLINAGIESVVIAKGFKTKLGKRGFAGLFVANFVSVGLAYASLYLSTPR